MYVFTSVSNRTASPELIPCEFTGSCSTANCSTTAIQAGSVADTFIEDAFFLENGQVAGAVCAEGTTGFLCAECADDYVKINGQCVVCTGFDVLVILLSLAMSFFTALFLLHSSTGLAHFSDDDIRNIWHKFDTEQKGYLVSDQVFNVLRMTGKHMTQEVFATYMIDHFGLNIKSESKTAEDGGSAAETVVEGGDGDAESKGDKRGFIFKSGTVTMEDFVSAFAAHRPSRNLGTLIFFIQTLGLIVKDSSAVLEFASALDLNAEESSASCM